MVSVVNDFYIQIQSREVLVEFFGRAVENYVIGFTDI